LLSNTPGTTKRKKKKDRKEEHNLHLHPLVQNEGMKQVQKI
jgi:hypothetical protein